MFLNVFLLDTLKFTYMVSICAIIHVYCTVIYLCTLKKNRSLFLWNGYPRSVDTFKYFAVPFLR